MSTDVAGFDRGWIAPLLLGLALRVVYLIGAWDVPAVADEVTYLEQAEAWRELGVYGGKWAPGNAAVLAALGAFVGEGTLQAGRVLNVLLSVPVALAIMALARAVFGERAGRVAGWGQALYLPLVGFTHTLWPETSFLALFLPALLLLMRRDDRPWTAPLAGALLALALLFKESGLYLVPLLAVWLGLRARDLVRPGLFVGGVLVVLLPWTLRNWDVYRRVVPVGLTLGVNSWHGLSTRYTNFDHPGMKLEQVYPLESFTYRTFLADPPESWTRAQLENPADKDRADFRRGLAFMADHPGFFVRTRVVKLADFVTPLSFLVRGYRLRAYGAPVDSPLVRRPAVVWAVLSVPLVMALAVLGLSRRALAPGARSMLLTVLLYFLATGMLVAMSRYRAPVEPLLVVAASGFLAGERAAPGRVGRWLAPAVLGALVLLWLVGYPALSTALEQAW